MNFLCIFPFSSFTISTWNILVQNRVNRLSHSTWVVGNLLVVNLLLSPKTRQFVCITKNNRSRVSPVGQDLCLDLFRSTITNRSVFIPLTEWIYIWSCAATAARNEMATLITKLIFIFKLWISLTVTAWDPWGFSLKVFIRILDFPPF